jgi:DNA mismatch repair ATPase MutL
MRELSLHILDLVQNSISANANFIEILIKEDLKEDIFEICIKDNGKGMTKEFIKSICDPFTTTRTTRKVGLGIPLFKAAAMRCNGDLQITSKLGCGTTVKVWFVHSHIDRAPLGNIDETIHSLIVCNPSIDFLYRHIVDQISFQLDTRQIKQILGELDIQNIEVISWLREYINEGISNLYGGVR